MRSLDECTSQVVMKVVVAELIAEIFRLLQLSDPCKTFGAVVIKHHKPFTGTFHC